MAKYLIPTLLTAISMTLLSGCVTQSFENNEPIVKNQANRDEMAATRVSLGLGYLKMGDMSQAKLNLEKAKKFSPNLVQVHTAFAHYYETVGEATLAIGSFEQALTIKADSADTLNNYGVFLCRQGNVAAAEVQFLKAIAVPSYLLVSESYENLASCYLQNDDFEKAEMYLNKSIYHSPNRTNTLFQMVRLQYAMGNYKEAKLFLQKFERSTQRFTANSLSLAYKLYWKLGQRKTAGNYANMLVKMYPQSWEGKQYLLNELELIDADNLAKKYQLSQKEKNRQLSPSNNKRVVKLSPRKSANTPYTSSVKTVTPMMSTTTAAVTTTAVSTSLITSTTPSALGSETALLSTKVTGTVVATNKPASDTVVTIVEDVVQIDKVTAAATAAAVVNPVVSSTTEATLTQPISLITSTIPSAFGSGTASTKVAGTVTATSKPTSDTAVTKVENVASLNNEIDKVTAAATAAAAVNPVVSSTNEPTSTQPIPATRDVPLPDALPEIVDTEVISVEELSNNIELVDTQQVLHTVIPGENLYNISVEYNVKLNTLRKWNNLSEKNKIRIGDKLYVVEPQTVNNIND